MENEGGLEAGLGAEAGQSTHHKVRCYLILEQGKPWKGFKQVT